MNKEAILIAKVNTLKKNFENIKHDGIKGSPYDLKPLLARYQKIVIQIRSEFDGIFEDLPEIKLPTMYNSTRGNSFYSQREINPLLDNLKYVLELYSSVNTNKKEEKVEEEKKISVKTNRIFISHGRSEQWRKLQSYVEKDLEYNTLELAQEANLGRTILQKLYEEAKKCSIAVIVMTGDDHTAEGEIRMRENVMHEIGFFQGSYGLNNVVLLHENGVNIPSNIHGLVYIPFPENTIEATFGALLRELKTMINK